MEDQNCQEEKRELPKYSCHKEVHALKIKNIEYIDSDGGIEITPADESYAPFYMDGDYSGKHKPESGGYYVVYRDGYKSYSPAKAFEPGYKVIPL